MFDISRRNDLDGLPLQLYAHYRVYGQPRRLDAEYGKAA